MRAFHYGSSVRLQSDHPLDDTTLRNEDYLPRSVGLMPDNSLAVDLTLSEAFQIGFKEPMVHKDIQSALRSVFFPSDTLNF